MMACRGKLNDAVVKTSTNQIPLVPPCIFQSFVGIPMATFPVEGDRFQQSGREIFHPHEMLVMGSNQLSRSNITKPQRRIKPLKSNRDEFPLLLRTVLNIFANGR